ncbi:pentatricopeptide repeat-containing protein At2g34400-like [Selaginella moellendorffii]|uniref:pentatricopeptide repeat-containing protein At2g34400-like n=1 Tax=Selaginella moellendorffii TaxID=88036 RepID=UPI000D1C5ABA|nr:pentatricopeptide repeat-containing protein At2g34400-like [Selaginella moellendorffii]|eukprot:XP_024545877.1 pentatricopeptide repeat-containing protein At2g34400-like [Selaginella moellendorffii]
MGRQAWRLRPGAAMKTMPFGRYAGRQMGDLPGSFLSYVSRRMEGSRWAAYAQMIMDWRDRIGIHGGDRTQRVSSSRAAREESRLDRRRRSRREEKYATILLSCLEPGALSTGKWMHERIVKRGLGDSVFLGNLLIKLYGKCGAVEDARSVFDALGANRNAFSSILMIIAYAHNGHLGRARQIFFQMPCRDVVSWTGMIALHSNEGCFKESLDLYKGMLCDGMKPVRIGFITALDACIHLKSLAEGRALHSHIVESGLESHWKVKNSLLCMYGFCGSVSRARKLFLSYSEKDQIESKLTKTLLVAVYAANGRHKDALKIFQRSKEMVFFPITYIVVLEACASARKLQVGRRVHSRMPEVFQAHGKIGAGLVNLYGSCGCLESARKCFDKMMVSSKDGLGVLPWSAIVAAYASNGHSCEALRLFRTMQLDGTAPNAESFRALVFGCCREGKLDDAREQLLIMVESYGITPDYASVMDLLARSGFVDGSGNFREGLDDPRSQDQQRKTEVVLRPKVVEDVYGVLRKKLLPKHVDLATWLDTDVPNMPFSLARHPLEVAQTRSEIMPIPKQFQQPRPFQPEEEEKKLEIAARMEERKRRREILRRNRLRRKARIKSVV